MIKKENIIIGIGLVILIICAGVTYQNYAYAKLAKKQIDTLNATIQQQSTEIVKLVKEVKTKQAELNSVSAELVTTKRALNEVSTPGKKTAPQPPVKAAPKAEKK
ncbi:MAG: hypothetical protein Q7K98_03285 [Candidatus Omnitrophota bacterium]|nr:hypothetical protein [Candidatus Omnitrophota bacterium]